MFFFNEIIINNYRPSDVESEDYFFRIRGKAKKEQICAVLFCFVMKKKNSGAILQIYWLS